MNIDVDDLKKSLSKSCHQDARAKQNTRHLLQLTIEAQAI
jgi:hypothetical protein